MRLLVASIFITALTACAGPESDSPPGRIDPPPPKLQKLGDGAWLHKSYDIIEPWGRILSHGLVIQTKDGALILIDTAWGNSDTDEILQLMANEFGEMPEAAIVTHAHNDKMGGVDSLNEHMVQSFAHPFTNADAPTRELTQTTHTLSTQSGQNAGQPGLLRHPLLATHETSLQVFYPGAGHTRDNIVIYHPPSKTLFGGCLIRPSGASNLGNTADGDVLNWAGAVRLIAQTFPDAEIVVPSHGAPGGRDLLDHTIALADRAAQNIKNSASE